MSRDKDLERDTGGISKGGTYRDKRRKNKGRYPRRRNRSRRNIKMMTKEQRKDLVIASQIVKVAALLFAAEMKCQ